MMKTLIVTSLAAIALSACINSNASPNADQNEPFQTSQAVSIADFESVAGTGWSGTLSYLDYTKGTRESIPVQVSIDQPSSRSIIYAIKYPGEAKYNSRENIKLSKSGDRLNNENIVERSQLTEGGLKIVTEKTGKDDNRPAMIRTTYMLTPQSFIIRKDVKFSGEMNYFNRNEFNLTR